MNVTTQYYLTEIRENPNTERALRAKQMIENEISMYRLAAWEMPRSKVGYLCNLAANKLDRELKDAIYFNIAS
jgi:hypothetical protein